MVKVQNIKNAKIENAFKNLGFSAEPLSNAEYKTLVKKYRLIKEYNWEDPPEFGDKYKSRIIIAKLPDNLTERKYKGKDGNEFYSVRVVLGHDEEEDKDIWSSFTTDKQEMDTLVALAGNMVIIVGQIRHKPGKEEGQEFINIVKYRGCLVPGEEGEEDDGEDDEGVDL